MDSSRSPEDGMGEAAATVPLLLNPAYARCKSSANDELRNFRMSLKWCALDHSSTAGKAVSYLSFLLFTLLLPTLTSLSFSSAPTLGPVTFNQLVQIPESTLASIAFLTLASSFRRHGLRQLLLLDDALRDDSLSVRRSYARELDRAFRCLAYILLPAFCVELAHKILFFATVPLRFPDLSPLIMAATLASWVYRTGVFLLVCVLFRLTCELQILRFEGFHTMFGDEGEGDVRVIFKEHIRIKQQLLVTSHRYRAFIIGCLVTITISQLGALLLIFGSKSEKNFCNSGDIVACSIVQLSGFLLCLLGAARITHRAQRIVSIASRWHVALCCSQDGAKSDNFLEQQREAIQNSDASDDNENDDTTTTFSQGVTFLLPPAQGASSFGSRQALVTYFQYNGGGITLFGFSLDRGLLHTLFAFEMTLVLWILSKVVVVSS